MMHAAIYDPETGRILQAVSAMDADSFAANLPDDGWTVIAEPASPSTQYVNAGAIVDMPPAPGDWAEWDWSSHAWIDPRDDAYYQAQTEADMAAIRAERDRLLAATDSTQTATDAPLTDEQREQWRVYRQALRDMTMADEPVWPVPPGTWAGL